MQDIHGCHEDGDWVLLPSHAPLWDYLALRSHALLLVEDCCLVASSYSCCTGYEGYHAQRVGGGGKQCITGNVNIGWMDCALPRVELDAGQEQVKINQCIMNI